MKSALTSEPSANSTSLLLLNTISPQNSSTAPTVGTPPERAAARAVMLATAIPAPRAYARKAFVFEAISCLFGTSSLRRIVPQERGGKTAGDRPLLDLESGTAGEQQCNQATTSCGHADSDLLHGELPLALRPPPQALSAAGRIRSAEGLTESEERAGPRPCRLSPKSSCRRQPPLL